MFLDVLPLSGGGARLVRVYGQQPCITLPRSLPAPDGGTLAITELGDYCFSASPRGLPAPETLCRYEADDNGGGTPVLLGGGVPLTEDGNFTAVCGSFLEELTLPASLRLVGSCAFYNCRALRSLSFGAGELTFGSDVFLNCFELKTLVMRASPEQATGLFALVNNIAETVSALFWPEGAAAPLAGFCYPAYWEDYEETPAHILLHTFSGQGYHYRQCFAGGRVLPAEYDAIFTQGHSADDAATMALLCFYRLRWPWSLGGAAADAYREFLAANTALVLKKLIAAQDMDALRALLDLDVMSEAAYAEGAAIAAKAGSASAAALLADAQHKKFAPKSKKARYDFDF